MGLHSGEVFVGALGGERMEFTVIGDVVNIAQRLEEMTRQIDSDVIVSTQLFEEAGDIGKGASGWDYLPELELRGRAQTFRLKVRRKVRFFGSLL